VLFDIDRTLLDTHGGNKRAMLRAGVAVYGTDFDLEGVDRSGRLDAHILQDAASRLGQSVNEEQLDAFRELYAAELKSELEHQREMPGAVAWVQALEQIQSVTLGLVTGNFGSAAAVKIPAIGLDFDVFTANGFGDAGERRADLVIRAREACPKVKKRHTLIIGDTPRDIACAKENDCPCLCVATGDFSAEQLYEVGAPFVVESLVDPDATDFISEFLLEEGPIQ
jgi:phosphoglycolate phosphatase-like HAD superfamily hydrolase